MNWLRTITKRIQSETGKTITVLLYKSVVHNGTWQLLREALRSHNQIRRNRNLVTECSEAWNSFHARTDLATFFSLEKRIRGSVIEVYKITLVRESRYWQLFAILSNARTGRIKWNQKVADSNNWNVFLTTMTLPEAVGDAKVYIVQNTSEHVYRTEIFQRLLCVKARSLSWK